MLVFFLELARIATQFVFKTRLFYCVQKIAFFQIWAGSNEETEKTWVTILRQTKSERVGLCLVTAYELGQPRSGYSFLRVQARQPLQVRTQKLDALTVAQQCLFTSKHFENPIRTGRYTQERSTLPIFGDSFGLSINDTTVPEIVFPDQG